MAGLSFVRWLVRSKHRCEDLQQPIRAGTLMDHLCPWFVYIASVSAPSCCPSAGVQSHRREPKYRAHTPAVAAPLGACRPTADLPRNTVWCSRTRQVCNRQSGPDAWLQPTSRPVCQLQHNITCRRHKFHARGDAPRAALSLGPSSLAALFLTTAPQTMEREQKTRAMASTSTMKCKGRGAFHEVAASSTTTVISDVVKHVLEG